jgi:NAD(P)-dependent dehydrogenase (short-subunit alcohol dehydrogenase family)
MTTETVGRLVGPRLSGKVAVITGGVSGMGLGTVRLFLEHGAKVVVGDVQDAPGRRLEAEFGDGFRYQHCDVAKEADVAALVQRAVDEFGALDCMFNNAGFGGVAGEIADIEIGDGYRNTVDVLFTGVLSGMKHAARVMKAQRRGSIISTASVAGIRGGWGPHVYSAMKAAVINLTRSAALELGEHDIRVNAICPGFIATPIFAGNRNMSYEQKMRFSAELERSAPGNSPIARAGNGRDIGNMALFLASDDSTFITGQAFPVDGGITAGNRRVAGAVSPIQQLAERIEQEGG